MNLLLQDLLQCWKCLNKIQMILSSLIRTTLITPIFPQVELQVRSRGETVDKKRATPISDEDITLLWFLLFLSILSLPLRQTWDMPLPTTILITHLAISWYLE